LIVAQRDSWSRLDGLALLLFVIVGRQIKMSTRRRYRLQLVSSTAVASLPVVTDSTTADTVALWVVWSGRVLSLDTLCVCSIRLVRVEDIRRRRRRRQTEATGSNGRGVCSMFNARQDMSPVDGSSTGHVDDAAT